MAKVQTRRSVSIPGKLRDRAKAFGLERGISVSQMAEQALEAALDGRLKLEVGRSLSEQRRHVAKLSAVPEPKHPAGEFCALCTRDVGGRPIRREPFGRGDSLVNVCGDCTTSSVRRTA